jgi:hypothetical protein
MAGKKKKGAKSTQASPAQQLSDSGQPARSGSRLHVEPSGAPDTPKKQLASAHGGSQASICHSHSKGIRPSTPGLKKASSSGPLNDSVHLNAAASGDVQLAGGHKSGSKHRRRWPRGSRRKALAWGLFFMSLGALVALLGISLLEPADEGTQINIPLPGDTAIMTLLSSCCSILHLICHAAGRMHVQWQAVAAPAAIGRVACTSLQPSQRGMLPTLHNAAHTTGGKSVIINIPGIDLAALQPSQRGERIGGRAL